MKEPLVTIKFLVPMLQRVISRLVSLGLWRASLALFAATLLLAVLVSYLVGPALGRSFPMGGEGYDGYIELAQNLVNGNGYVFAEGGHKVFHRPPLYPVLLIPGVLLPESLWRLYVSALNAALLAGAAAMTFLLTRALFSSSVAWAAWLIVATNPFMIWSAKNPLSALLQTFLYAATLYLCWLWYSNERQRTSISRKLLVGTVVVLTAGIYSHGTMLAVALLILTVFAVWSARIRHWPIFRSALLIGFAIACLIAPWTIRNYRATGLRIPVAGNFGLAYFAGNAHWGITGGPLLPHDSSRHSAELRHLGLPDDQATNYIRFYGFVQPRIEAMANAKMIEHIKERPSAFAKKVFLNALEYYFPAIYQIFPPEGHVFSRFPLRQRFSLHDAHPDTIPRSLYYAVLLVVAVGGLRVLFRQKATRKTAWFILGAWAIYALPYFPFLTFVGHGLYNFGTVPALAICSAAFLMRRDLNAGSERSDLPK